MDARNSTVRDSGAGVMLGLAAGDQGAGAAYGHHTQLAILIAYELLRSGDVEEVRVRSALSRLTGGRSGRSRVRGTPPWLQSYLEQERSQGLGRGPHDGIDVATRAVPIGVWYRFEARELVAAATRAAMSTHSDRPSAVAAAVMSGVIAGISHGQYGRDLVFGALEVGRMAESRLADDPTLEGDATSLLSTLESSSKLVGASPQDIVAQLKPGNYSLESVVAAIAIGAPLLADPFSVIADLAPLRRRDLEIVVSAMVGARAGLIKWPSVVTNDTWFAEIGRRLAERERMVDDLPDLFEVEDRLSHGPPSGFR